MGRLPKPPRSAGFGGDRSRKGPHRTDASSSIAPRFAEKLDDRSLRIGFQVAVRFHAVAAMRPFAQAIADRPSMAALPEQLHALSVLAQTDGPRAGPAAHRRRADGGRAAGQSCANWDLMEIGIRITEGEEREVGAVVPALAATARE